MIEQDYINVSDISKLRCASLILHGYLEDDKRVHKAHMLIVRAINDLEKKIETE